MQRLSVRFVLVVTAVLAGCAQTHVHVQATPSARPPGAKVLLAPPDVELYQLTAGGLQELQPEWTASAKGDVALALAEEMQAKGLQAIAYTSPQDPARGRAHKQVFQLHDVVGGAVISHLYSPLLQLPTKGDRLDWTLGEGVRPLREDTGADYAVFVVLRDSYSTGGRVALMVTAALLGGQMRGGTQVGFASLVDLRTGVLLWFNQMALHDAGDLRTPAAARRAVATLLTGFPP